MCRWYSEVLQFFLVHPGGPFFKNKDLHTWSIPKGLPEEGESLLETALREFKEETGIVPTPPYYTLDSIKQKAGKIVYAWCFLGDWDPIDGITSNTFELEWPPHSGRRMLFPEQDKAEWMNIERAKEAINEGQKPFLERAIMILGSNR